MSSLLQRACHQDVLRNANCLFLRKDRVSDIVSCVYETDVLDTVQYAYKSTNMHAGREYAKMEMGLYLQVIFRRGVILYFDCIRGRLHLFPGLPHLRCDVSPGKYHLPT